MAEKTLSTSIVHKRDIELSLDLTNFIPKQGEIIVYDTDETVDAICGLEV